MRNELTAGNLSSKVQASTLFEVHFPIGQQWVAWWQPFARPEKMSRSPAISDDVGLFAF
jgi:hypothetical protein